MLRAILTLGLIMPMLFWSHGVSRAARPPNVIIIQTDDQTRNTVKGFYRSGNGRRHLIMPNVLNRLIRPGAELRNYYAATPVCAPSRGSLLTGRYPLNSGLRVNSGPWGGWRGWERSVSWNRNLALTLQDAGYRTAHFGKFLNRYHRRGGRVDPTVPPGWDRWWTVAVRRATPYYGYRINSNGQARGPYGPRRYSVGSAGHSRHGVDPPACEATTRRADGRACLYLTDAVTRRAVKEISRNRKRGRPFFIQVDYQGPHGDLSPPAGPTPATRHAGSAAGTRLPRPPSFNEADISDKPPGVRDLAGRRLSRQEIRNLTRYYRQYVETLRSVDDGVGAILDELRRTGQLDNTYIFFLTDHGLFMGEHRLADAKFMPYEPASRTSASVRGPGIRPGTKVREITGNIDVPVTVMRLAKASPDYEVDGRSIRRFWRHPRKTTRRPFQISLFSNGRPRNLGLDDTEPLPGVSGLPVVTRGGRDKPFLPYRGFRVGRYKYIKYVRDGGEELYDLRRDPHELRNRIHSYRYRDVREYMREHLSQVTSCVGLECRAELPPLPPRR